MADFDESKALKYYPFDGDFGESGDRIFSNKMVNCRKAHWCFECDDEIQIGGRARRLTHMFDGEVHTAHWCYACCEAMAKSWTDHGGAICARYVKGQESREKRLNALKELEQCGFKAFR